MSASFLPNLPSRLYHLFSSIVAFFVYAILGATLLSFPVCLVVHCTKYSQIFSTRELIWILPAVLLLLITIILAKSMTNMSNRRIALTMILLECIIALVMIFSFDSQPCSDYSAIWQAANEMASNTFIGGITPNHYMYYFNWQLGIAAFESLFIRLGADFLFFKLLNALLLMAIQYMIFRLVFCRFGKTPACYAYAFATLYMPWCLSIPQFTNHHIGLVVLLLCLYLLDQHTFTTWGIAGIFAACLNVLRPLGIIIVLSAICQSVVLLCSKQKKHPIFMLLVFLICYVLALSFFDFIFMAVGYTDAPISQARMPYYKFQKGFYDYRTYREDLEAFSYDYNAYNQAMKNELLEHLRTTPLQALVFVANKMVRYLGLFDYQFEMSYNHDVSFYTTYPVKALYSMSWFQYIGIIIFSICGYRKYHERYPLDIYQIFFIGNTLAYFFIEAFSSYRFESYPFLLILAALGVSSYPDKSLQRQNTHSS